MAEKYVVDRTNNTLYEKLEMIFGSSLSANEYRNLISGKNYMEWNDSYEKFIKNAYLMLTGLREMVCSVTETNLMEPIYLYKINDKIIAHAFSLSYIKQILFYEFGGEIEHVPKKVKELNISSLLSINTTTRNVVYDVRLPERLTHIFLKLYVIAEHAAQHYHLFMKYRDPDYKHALYYGKSSMRNENIYLQSMFSTEPDPDGYVATYLKRPDHKSCVKLKFDDNRSDEDDDSDESGGSSNDDD